MNEKTAEERKAEVDAFLERVRGTFIDDVQEARRRLNGSNQQFDRRAYIRAIFASVEGTIFECKRAVLRAHEAGLMALTPAEAAVLREETYDLSDQGKPVVRPKYSPLLPTLRFAIPLFARMLGAEYAPAVDGGGWQAFRQALEIRHRVTHPRSLEDGQLSDDDLRVVHQANEWFDDLLRGLFNALRGRAAEQADAADEAHGGTRTAS